MGLLLKIAVFKLCQVLSYYSTYDIHSMDDFGSSSGGFSSSDAAGFSTDAGGCNAFSSSDTGGISFSYGGVSDSAPLNVDSLSNIGMTSNCDSGLGVSDYVQCDFTGNNAYYHVCSQNSMENVNECANQIQVDSSFSTDPIPVSPFVPYLTTPKDVTLDGYLNMAGHVESWKKNIPRNKKEDKELILLRSKIAQMQIILASSKADEYKKAAIRAQIRDLTSRMEQQGNQRRQTIYAITKCQKQKNVPEVTKVKVPETNPGKDTDSVQNRRRTCRIVCYWIIIVVLIAIALGVGLGVAGLEKKQHDV